MQAGPPTGQFVLRSVQLEAMGKAAEPSFEDETCVYLRTNHAAEVAALNDSVLKRRVKIAIARARSHGVDLQSSITAFVALMFVIAPNFDEHPIANQVLHDETVPANDRLSLLPQRMSLEGWQDVRSQSNPKVWEA